MKTRLANPLALAVLALLFERPMHPYEMAATMKERHKEESIKLRYGSLYTVIELLLTRGFIRPKETSREGKRPERTVYALTGAGLDELRDWMRDLLRDPAKEYPQFEAGLCLMPVLPPAEAVGLLRDRALRLTGTVAQLEAQLAEVVQQDLSAMTRQELPPALAAQTKFPPLFTVEGEFRLAMIKAELAFVADLVRRITEDGWGPVGLWRDIQAAAQQQHEKTAEAEM
ncbi:MAG TPA: PadR family transcriptional regulator [Xanthobacteraceae bacterium]|jgi:DNA-binding PadR family transcriptional regulator